MSELNTLLPAVTNLPSADIDVLVKAVRQGRIGLETLKARAGSAAVRSLCDQLLEVLTKDAEYLEGWITGAAVAAAALREQQQVDVVWTGPLSNVDTGRFTSQVVVDLIGQAERQLLLASYATNPEERTLLALAEAARRGVDITVLQERHEDNPNFRGAHDPFARLPVRHLVWPAEHRAAGASLHPKLIVVDDRIALVGSANLTGRALDSNVECGVLLRGGPHPKIISDHVWALVRAGVFLNVPARSL